MDLNVYNFLKRRVPNGVVGLNRIGNYVIRNSSGVSINLTVTEAVGFLLLEEEEINKEIKKEV